MLKNGLNTSVASMMFLWSIICFTDKTLIDDVFGNGQTISYCAAYAHCQNGEAEKAIQNEQEWKDNVATFQGKVARCSALSLWPYAVRMAVNIINRLPYEEDCSEISLFWLSRCALVPVVKIAKAKKQN